MKRLKTKKDAFVEGYTFASRKIREEEKRILKDFSEYIYKKQKDIKLDDEYQRGYFDALEEMIVKIKEILKEGR